MDCSSPVSSVPEIFQARILKWVAISYSWSPPNTEIEPTFLESPALAGRFFTTSTTWEALHVSRTSGINIGICNCLGPWPFGVLRADNIILNFTQEHWDFKRGSNLMKLIDTHSSVLAWRIPGTGEPGGLPSMGLHRVWHDWSDLAVAAGNGERMISRMHSNL